METALTESVVKEGIIPPLPEDIPVGEMLSLESLIPEQIRELQEKIEKWYRVALRSGCYLLNYTPSRAPFFQTFDGTLRVTSTANAHAASGDLYRRPYGWHCTKIPGVNKPLCLPVMGAPPDPSAGVPTFARDRYAFYLRVTKLPLMLPISTGGTLEFEIYDFDPTQRKFTGKALRTVFLSRTTAPSGYPSPASYYHGDVKDSAGTIVGRLTMGWISAYLRKALVEIDRMSGSEAPLGNGNATQSVTWHSIFESVGWDVNAYESNTSVPDVPGSSWTDADCHDAMLKWRDAADLDEHWRYYLLCVDRLQSTERGIMYDAYGTDSNNVPREGAAIASDWIFPDEGQWGKCKGHRFGSCPGPYFRTAVHEIAHAMMLFHPGPSTGNEIMQVTPNVAVNASAAVPPVSFPDDIDWRFSETATPVRPSDAHVLRHAPDIVVRPGSVLRFGQDVGPDYSGVPLPLWDAASDHVGVELRVNPVLDAVPLGAPVRLDFVLKNVGSEPILAPRDPTMKSGQVRGRVIGPEGKSRIFTTMVRYLDESPLQTLEPQASVEQSLTLLRGPDGALFPSAGVHEIVLELSWEMSGYLVSVSASASVMVTPAVEQSHASAALKMLTTPDTLPVLVLGGDHLIEGVAAIQSALKDPVLRPHYGYIEAKRLSKRTPARGPDLKTAAHLITDETVMSQRELGKMAQILKTDGTQSTVVKEIVKTLKHKARAPGICRSTKELVEAL